MATYYVDYVGGSDSNAGTSTGAPWQHCPGDSNATGVPASKTLIAGEIVAFKGGVTYDGQVTCGQAGSLQASGSNATINAAGVLASSGQNFTATVQVGDYVYIHHTKTSVFNTWVESCGVWPVASIDSATQLTLSGFDGVAHTDAEMTYRVMRMITYKTGTDWGTGLAIFTGNDSRSYAFTASSKNYLRWQNLRFEDYTGNDDNAAIYNPSGVGNIVDACEFNELTEMSPAFLGQYYVFRYCTTYSSLGFIGMCKGDPNYALLEHNSVDGIHTRTVYGGRFMVVRYNTLLNVIGTAGHADTIGFIDEGALGNEYGWIYGNIINKFVEGVALYGNDTDTSVPGHFVVHSNVFVGWYATLNKGDAAILIKAESYNYVCNNTFIGTAGRPCVQAIRFENDGTPNAGPDHITVYNNAYYSSGVGAAVRIWNGWNVGHIFDYNHYYAVSGGNPMWEYATWLSEAQWKAMGYDAHMVTADPLFVDPTGASPDVHLQEGSPLRGVGTDLSSLFTLDADGNVRTAWDIGAYEYQSEEEPPAPAAVGVSIVMGW